MAPSPWSPYRPSPSAPWDLSRAWTLRRRAGFAATWNELRRDLDDGPEAALDRVLAGTCRSEGVPDDFATTADLLGDAAASAGDVHRLQAWWLFRMLFTPDPLAERLAMVWHNHFATSQLKVEDVSAMKRQNDTFRRHARGLFGDLLRAMLSDPALLAWLDAPSNRKGKPNENLARELMELFTLGIGHYSEQDVKNSARTLTGRTVIQGQYAFRPDWHDDAAKTILGKSGRFDGDQLADILLDQPATAQRLAWRLCQAFLGENVADEAAVSTLADRLRRDDLHVGRAVAVVLRSELFFSKRNLHARVSGPTAFVVGSARAFELFDPPPSTVLLAEWVRRLGQELFFPPNVAGWPGGRSWLSSRTIVARANFAAALVEGRLHAGSSGDAPELMRLAARHGRAKDALAFFSELLIGRRLDAATGGPFNRAVALLLARPEAQLT
jgi:uncharacterized protein (DUF1800 family)